MLAEESRAPTGAKLPERDRDVVIRATMHSRALRERDETAVLQMTTELKARGRQDTSQISLDIILIGIL